MMLFFCFRSRRDRWAGLGAGLIAGWGMGFYQMLRGQHFLSHTLFTMIGRMDDHPACHMGTARFFS